MLVSTSGNLFERIHLPADHHPLHPTTRRWPDPIGGGVADNLVRPSPPGYFPASLPPRLLSRASSARQVVYYAKRRAGDGPYALDSSRLGCAVRWFQVYASGSRTAVGPAVNRGSSANGPYLLGREPCVCEPIP